MAITISGDSPNFSSATITSLTSTTLSDGTNSTSSTNCIQGSAKAWVNFTSVNGGSATTTASYNVSSVTQTSTALYTISFTNALADSNYAWAGAGGNSVNVAQTPWLTTQIGNLSSIKTTTALFIAANYSNNTRNADTANANYSIVVFR